MNSNEIRNGFLRFFEEKGHVVVPSSSLVPHGDPTLLLTTAGMVQMKPYFLGEAVPPGTRLTSCQKCFRTTDIDCVGDASHLTFFEMLGNFSVGDYFKREAIANAWEFVTERLSLPKERLWVTVFLDDDEAAEYWLKLGVPAKRIARCGEKQNFWGPAGKAGPCGPCSEIHYDFGPDVGCRRPDCDPGCDCGRFLEIWNLVFMQYNQDESGKRTPLPKPNIDTGMGLERVSVLMQGKASVYETDIFTPIIDRVATLSGHEYRESESITKAMRVVAEHTRAATFLISDGVVPSNEGRGYVLRRILRRAALFGRKLGMEKAFLSEVAQVVIQKMSGVYPDLVTGRNYILKVIDTEEEKFRRTLDVGIAILETLIRLRKEFKERFGKFQTSWRHGKEDAVANFRAYCEDPSHVVLASGERDAIGEAFEPVLESLRGFEGVEGLNKIREAVESVAGKLSGFEVFILYDTYGFPKEVTAEIAAEHGISIDLEGFEKEMEAQRERARQAHKFGLTDKSGEEFYQALGLPPTEFLGYERLSTETCVVGLIVNGEMVESAFKGQEVEVILKRTPFYGEMGGQVGDTGQIISANGKVTVTDSRRPIEGLTVHLGKVEEGVVSVNETVEARVDRERRLDIARNHTATHLLHAALRKVLGEQVRQGGSLVTPNSFRFDFTHLIALSREELAQLHHLVNDNIRRNLTVNVRVMPYRQAVAEGALAFFGEKYGEEVRLVQAKDQETDQSVSAELCGGTHVRNTGEIGFFQITSEKSVGSGLRRIEAVTGRGAELLAEERFTMLEKVAQELESNTSEVGGKVAQLNSELSAERKRARALEGQLLRKIGESLLSEVKQVNGSNVVAARVAVSDLELLREMGDFLKDKLGSAVIVLGAVLDENPRFLAMVTPDLVTKGIHAGKIVKQVAQVTGGGGGGKPEIAQAGGKDKSKLDEALRLVPGFVSKG